MSKKRRTSSGVDGRHRPARSAPPPRGATLRSARGVLLMGGGILVMVLVVGAVVLGMGGRPPGTGLPVATPSRAAASASTGTPASPSGDLATIDPAATALPPIEGVACDPTEQVTYHAHAHLNIRVGGQLMVVPGDVGLRAACLFWLHTHQVHGVIHVEAPREQAFTLGQFFAVWGKPLDQMVVADWSVPEGSRLWIFVNGAPYTGDPRSIALENLTSIELQIGPAALDPLPYTFPAEFL